MPNPIFKIGVAVAAFLASGCATLTQGSGQSVYFDTSPSGATCDIMREGRMLYNGIKTPATLEIEKDKDDIVVSCRKDGYEEARIHTSSNFEGWTMGNILLGGIIGIGVDAASGAMHQYPSHVVVPLVKKE